MRRFAALAATTGVAAIAGLLLTANPAAAATIPTKVTITVKPTGGPLRTATLTCDPVGGTHKSSTAACGVLTTAAGNPAAIVPADVMCTMEYAPVKVKMAGRYNRKPVSFKRSYSNPCRLQAESGALFRI
jgi:Subtilisin inhibitor-like